MTNEITKSVDVDQLVRGRDAFKSEVESAFAHLAKAREIYEREPVGVSGTHKTAFAALPKPKFDSYSSRDEDTAEKFVQGYDALAWRLLMDESGLRSFMSSDDIQAWDEGIHAKTTPAFELSNIASTFEKLYADRPAMIARGVLSIFRSLSWNYKSNLPVKFGAKIVVEGRDWQGIEPTNARRIDDLIRFMHVADGLPQPDHREGFSNKFTFKPAVTADGYENAYLRVKGFKNGNLHVVFKRPDLVDTMNRAIAKTHPCALPAAR